MSTEYTEYGLKLDCEKQGCELHHRDHGHVYHPADPTEHTINNHAAVLVQRTVTTSEWRPVDE